MQNPAGKSFEDEVRRYYEGLAPDYVIRANRACNRAYRRLTAHWLGAAKATLELGCGPSSLLTALPSPFKAALDVSWPMLTASRGETPEFPRVQSDAQILPFRDACFEGVCCVNVLEHVPHPRQVLAEAVRVLRPGGRLLLITPNGNATPLLDALERFHFKLPEGPHRFLTTEETAALFGPPWRILAHAHLLAMPLGPDILVSAADRLLHRCGFRWGLFQYAVLEK